MRKIIILLFILTSSFNLFAQKNISDSIIELAKNDNKTMDHLDMLCNRFGGRPIGSDNYDNAAEWVARKFEEWGLEVEMQEAGTLPVGFNRGPWFGRLLDHNDGQQLHFVTPSYSSGTKGKQRGHVLIEPKTQEEFNRMRKSLKGAWVLVGGKNNGWALGGGEQANKKRRQIIEDNIKIAELNKETVERNAKNGTKDTLLNFKFEPALFYEQMVDAGILGIIQSADVPLRALYDRSVVFDTTMTIDKLPTVPDIKLDASQYDIIYKKAKERQYFQLEFEIRNNFKCGPVKYSSVIGKIEGSKYPDEVVIVSGHLDAFDVATGGVDCGVGIAPMMEAARLIKEAGGKPKRTILFIAFAGEEFGLLGAMAWCKANNKKLHKISNVFNRDGEPFPPLGISVPQAMYSDFVNICEPISKINPDFPFKVEVREPFKRPTSAGGTDATVFAMNKVPTFEFNCGDIKGYNFNYGEIWHTERDTYDKSIAEYQNHASVVIAIVAYGVADLPHILSREGMYIEDSK